jgi:putative ABC transport system permease protein
MWIILAPPARPDQLAVGVLGRLKPGVSIAAAQQEVLARHRQLHAHDRWGAQVEPVVYGLHDEFTWLTGRNLRLSLLVLFWAVTFVLLIGCVNVANLLLGRAVARHREMALRAALGSGRRRLVRQLLTESLLLSAAASVAGAVLAAAAVDYFRVARPIEMPPGVTLALNGPVLAFTALLSVLTAVAFGLAPAWKASRIDLNEALKSGGKGSGGGRHRLGKVLIVAEVMLTVVLLSGAGLLLQTLDRFRSAPLGFQPDGLIAASLHLPKNGYADAPHRSQFYARLDTALAALPGVQFAAVSSSTPFLGGGSIDVVAVQGRPEPPVASLYDTFLQMVSPDYFRAMGTPLEQGRFFDLGDGAQSEPVAIVNQALVRKYFPNQNPIGSHVRFFNGGQRGDPWMKVVGVVGNQKRTTVYNEMAWVDVPVLYRPVRQNTGGSANLIVRAAAGVSIGSAIQRAVAAIDPDVPVDEIQPVRNLESRALSYPRFRAALLGSLALLALLLAVVGLFGVLSHIVTQRTHEIGVRMALGAPRGTVLAMVLRQGLLLTAGGLVLGLAGARFLGRYLVSLLYGVRPAEPLLLVAVSLLLLAASVVAVYLPARRASRVDPMVALKYE